jgi:transketolase
MIYKELIKRMVEIDYKYKHGYLPSSCSALPIIKDIYDHFIKETDIFILSKGHAAMALYVVLEELGYKPDVSKPMATMDTKNGIFCSTGSLGHGLPIAMGIALAKKLKNEEGFVHVLLGDGECQEGTLWESFQILHTLKLNNLVIHIDGNEYQGMKNTNNDLLTNFMYLFSATLNITLYKYPKGYGISLIERKPIHLFKMSNEDYKIIMKELS